jgi:hypothetical protein
MYSSQAQPFYYQGPGYDNPSNEWDGYPPYVSVEGLEAGPAVSNLFFWLPEVFRQAPFLKLLAFIEGCIQ